MYLNYAALLYSEIPIATIANSAMMPLTLNNSSPCNFQVLKIKFPQVFYRAEADHQRNYNRLRDCRYHIYIYIYICVVRRRVVEMNRTDYGERFI